eukprot:831815-Amorphochlora_amoeboformis.AAC.1
MYAPDMLYSTHYSPDMSFSAISPIDTNLQFEKFVDTPSLPPPPPMEAPEKLNPRPFSAQDERKDEEMEGGGGVEKRWDPEM